MRASVRCELAAPPTAADSRFDVLFFSIVRTGIVLGSFLISWLCVLLSWSSVTVQTTARFRIFVNSLRRS